MGTMEPLRGQVPFTNGGYDRYENGYSRSLNGVPAGPAPYHDQPPYDRYATDR